MLQPFVCLNNYNIGISVAEFQIRHYNFFQIPEFKFIHNSFSGQHAVNYLMDSKWATGDDDVAILFKDRTDAIGFCQQYVTKNFVAA